MYLGMDGGGTKTDYILMDYTGKIASHVRTDTTHYMQIGMNQAVSLIRRGIEEACRLAGVGIEDIRCAFLGVPGFGERKRCGANRRAPWSLPADQLQVRQ